MLVSANNFIKKKALAQVFSCEFCKICKNTFFTEHLPVAASENYPISWKSSDVNIVFPANTLVSRISFEEFEYFSGSRQKRSSDGRCSVKKCVLKTFAKFVRKHLCQSLFFNRVPGLATLLKIRLWHRCFPVNFAKFLRTPFLQNTLKRLLLAKWIALHF